MAENCLIMLPPTTLIIQHDPSREHISRAHIPNTSTDTHTSKHKQTKPKQIQTKPKQTQTKPKQTQKKWQLSKPHQKRMPRRQNLR